MFTSVLRLAQHAAKLMINIAATAKTGFVLAHRKLHVYFLSTQLAQKITTTLAILKVNGF